MHGRRRSAGAAGEATALDREAVAGAAEAGDGAGGHRRDHRGVPPRLAGVGVREVQLDDRPVERGQRVVERPGVVRERAGVDDDGGAAAPRARGSRRRARPRGSTGGARASWPCSAAASRARWRRGRRAWRCRRLRLALAEQVQVRPAQQQHDGLASCGRPRERRPHGRRSGVDGGRSTPATGSTPSGPSSTKVSPSTAFLSRPISVDQLVGVEAGRQRRRQVVAGRRRRRCSATRVGVDAAERAGPARPRTPGRSRPPRRGAGRSRRRSRARGPSVWP